MTRDDGGVVPCIWRWVIIVISQNGTEIFRNDERLMNKTEMRMLQCIQGVSLRDQIRSEEDQESDNSSADSNKPDAEATTLVRTCET